MQDNQKDLFKTRLQRLKNENRELRKKLGSQKKDHINVLKSLSRTEGLLNGMPVGFILIQEGKVIKINEVIQEYLDYGPDDIIGINFLDFIHADEREHVMKTHKLWNSGRMSPDRYDARLLTSGGMSVLFEIRCKRIRFQNRTALLLTLTSLKERLEQEAEKIKKEKTDALITMASGVKDKLIAFNNIIQESIREYKAGLPSGHKNFEDIFQKLSDASAKALKVTDELEIIASTEKDKQAFLPLNLNETVKAVVQSANRSWKEWADTRDIKITIRTYLRSTAPIEGDTKRIKEAISHIIYNAIEAMPEGGEIYISTEDNNGDAHIYIQDNGKGIPYQFKDRIFDPFFTTKAGAMGLGLSMSLSIIKRHEGDIEVMTLDGEGAVFHVRLPLARQKPLLKNKAGKKKIADSQVLIIQDSDVAREVFSHILKIKGCRIQKAVNATEGLVKLKKKPFNMVIADESALNMERDRFIEKAVKVRPGIYTVIITGYKSSSDKDFSCGHKADLIIRKPIDVNSAVKRISGVLAAR